jgi:dihydroxyacetone kinase-like predicted kinase
MVLTIQGAMASMKNFENQSMSPGEYLKNFAEQMLLHSRGCSGVILSLFMQGFAETVANDDFSKENVYKALENVVAMLMKERKIHVRVPCSP